MSPPWLGPDWHLAGNFLWRHALFTRESLSLVWLPLGFHLLERNKSRQRNFCFELYVALVLMLETCKRALTSVIFWAGFSVDLHSSAFFCEPKKRNLITKRNIWNISYLCVFMFLTTVLLYDLMTAHHRSVCMRIMEVTLHVKGRSRCPKQGATVSLRLKSVQIKIPNMAQMNTFPYFKKRYIGHRCVT